MQHTRDIDLAFDRRQTTRSTRNNATPLEQLEGALGRLTMPSEQRPNIPADAQSLLNVKAIFAVKDTPRARIGGTKKARRDLEILAKRAIDLHTHIRSMHGDALAFIREQCISGDGQRVAGDPLTISADVEGLAGAAQRAHRGLAGADEKPAGPKGRRHLAAAVTEKAARVYERLTGNAATLSVDSENRAYGPFLSLLAEVFRILNVRASPESQTRAFLKEKRRKKTTS